MPGEELRQLKQVLLEAYGGFADRRIKNIDVGDRFIVDKRTAGDIAADRNVYGWFCSMFLEVRQSDVVQLTILNIPSSADVQAWLAAHGQPFGRDGHKITIGRGDQDMLLNLSAMVHAITARGKRYNVPHYKYAVPRVVDALATLRGALAMGWGV